MRHLISALLVIIAGAPAMAQPANLALQGELAELPRGWFMPEVIRQRGYEAGLVADQGRDSGQSLRLAGPAEMFGNIMQSFDAGPYRGRVVEFAADVRVEGGRAQLWLRADREGDVTGFFDNMGERPITARECERYSIVGRIDDDAAVLNIGVMLIGGGEAWIDDISFEVLEGVAVENEAARALDERGLENMVAFTHLLGYVRFFYPGDEAAAAEYEKLAIRGARAVEGARSPDQLAEVLRTLFDPIAPGLQIGSGPREVVLSSPAGERPTGRIAWRHHGVGLAAETASIYQSARLPRPLTGDGTGVERVFKSVGSGVWCVLPLTLYTRDDATLPRPVTAPTWAGPWQIGWRPSGNDRATRLGAVMLAWTILQHFYPYFDVIESDWDAALRAALRSAAADEDDAAFAGTLRRLIAQLQDGHGMVVHASDPQYFLPLALDIAEDRLVVTHSDFETGMGPQRGDLVVNIDGRPWREVADEHAAEISAATPGFARWRLCQSLVRGHRGHAMIEVEGAGGITATYRIERTTGGSHEGATQEARPGMLTEIEPGIWYIDLDRIRDRDFRAALPQLAEARGLIFDMRGYPAGLSTVVISHLIDEPVTCAQWHVPIVLKPDREGMTFNVSNWHVLPRPPRLTAPAAFIIDGRAVSYAETYMGIVEHYELAEIVGEPTAGTNGNINQFALPGGYTVVFTGMKVLKHDGAQHHGVGILPTVPVSRTIEGVRAGRDEMLKRAIDVVGRP
jgi:hypothetical protein